MSVSMISLLWLLHMCGSTVNGAISSSNTTTSPGTGNIPCDALIDAGLRDLLLLPTDIEYAPRIEAGWWSASARLYPWCIAQPKSTQDVSAIVQTLVSAETGEWTVAIRGGGHNQWPSNNVANGVTIDLGFMNETTYDASTGLASIGPGGNWGLTYTALAPYNVTAIGARVANVGISGFLLGGGDSYYSGRYGFGCDNVINYELVLPNGTIVNANRTSHADLHKALKGGGSNFGIVTRFDVVTAPYTDIYAGGLSWSTEYNEDMIEAFVDFTELSDAAADDQLIVLWMYDNATSSEITTYSSLVNSQGHMNTTSFDAFLAIPDPVGSMEVQTLYDYAVAGESAAGLLNNWWTFTYKNNAATMRKAVALHSTLVSNLKTALGPGAFNTDIVFQPIPAYYRGLSDAQGGNMLNMSSTDNGVLFLLEVNILTGSDADKAVGHAYGDAMMAELQAAADEDDDEYGWMYLNYADPTQNPLASYGEDNVALLRRVADEVDPQGWFQTRFAQGFKISRVVG